MQHKEFKMYSENRNISEYCKLLLSLLDKKKFNLNLNTLSYQTLTYAIHGNIQKGCTRTIN